MADDNGPPPSLQKVRAACKKRGATGAKGLGRWFISFAHFNIQGTLHSNENSGTFEMGVKGMEIFQERVQKIVEFLKQVPFDQTFWKSREEKQMGWKFPVRNIVRTCYSLIPCEKEEPINY